MMMAILKDFRRRLDYDSRLTLGCSEDGIDPSNASDIRKNEAVRYTPNLHERWSKVG
jgi:hypothetical protein